MSERVSSSTKLISFFHLLISLLFMAVLTFVPESEKPVQKPRKRNKPQQKPKEKPKPKPKPPSSWDQIKNMFTCKQIEDSKIHDPSKTNNPNGNNGYSKLGNSCSSICSFRDVANGNTRVVHRADNSPESSSVGQETGPLMNRKRTHHVHGSTSASTVSASSRTVGSSMRSNGGGGSGGGGHQAQNKGGSRGMQLRKLSGCYECHAVLDASTRFPSARGSISVCSECGEVFPKIESLEHHQAVRHAVSELGPEDSGRNIVEIIFKSSWLKKDNPIYNIERILKVHNTRRTIQRFEDCRDAVKIRANANTKKNPRCAADGNELLRFHCTTLACSLGARGSSSLCGSVPGCGVCTIIRHGFQGQKAAGAVVGASGGDGGKGVRTTASSGRAHDCLGVIGVGQARRAMLVCRVIAGKVRRMAGDGVEDDVASPGAYDSVAGYAGVYSNLEELYVFNPKAILPCFVVIYKAIES